MKNRRREPRHPFEIGTHLPAPFRFSSERGSIDEGSEIVILRADHPSGIYTVMDCLTGLVIFDTRLDAVPA